MTVTATLIDHGAQTSGEVRFPDDHDEPGRVHSFTADDLASARQEMADVLVAHARACGRPVAVHVADPDGQWALTVHPDGAIARGGRRTRVRVGRVTALAGVAAAVVVSVGLLASAATHTDHTPELSAGTPSAAPAAPSSPASPATSPPGTAPAASSVPRPVMFQGGVLPVSDIDGPSTLTDHAAAGYAQTPVGAAIAAAQLSARLSPTTGPDTFGHVIDEQMAGDRGVINDYRQAVTAAYKAAAKRAGVKADGQPILTPRASITGWTIDIPTLTGDVPVQLLSTTPDGTATVWTITMRWVADDWAIVVPTGATAWTKTTTTDPAGFTAFYEGEPS